GLAIAGAMLLGMLVQLLPQLKTVLPCWMLVYDVLLAAQTASQVQIWSSGPLLALTQLNGHPQSARANTDMAEHLAGVGALEEALAYSERAHQAANASRSAADERAGDRDVRGLALSCIARKAPPDTLLRQLGAENPQRPIGSVRTFHVLVQLAQDRSCSGDFWQALSERLAALYLSTDDIDRASPNLYSMLAGLENALGDYARAYRYTGKFLLAAPDNTRGQLMQLHFTTALGKVAEAGALKQRLLDKRERGELTVGEQQNLALYLP
ncbi:MAG: hypothetical protein ACK5HY_04235, partial [Parahaliea sp.]